MLYWLMNLDFAGGGLFVSSGANTITFDAPTATVSTAGGGGGSGDFWCDLTGMSGFSGGGTIRRAGG